MPALDVFEKLSREDHDAVAASFTYWGSVKPGESPLQSRVNKEHEAPLILAVKSKNHRFIAFHADGTRAWIVAAYYAKQGEKLDKRGRSAIRRCVAALNDYNRRMEKGTYYERR
jgi:hypothetical protein